MIYLYNIFLILSAAALLPVIIAAFIIQPKFRAGFFQKAGFYPSRKKNGKTAVFHAVSVGETNAFKALILQYKKMHPDENIVVTSSTRTGHALARKLFSDTAETVYFPYDFFFSVQSFFNAFEPEKVIIAETEIWPAFLYYAKKRGIKTFIANGRISPHSYSGYKKIKFFIAPFLNCCEKIFMQSEDDAARMRDIGADAEKIETAGNLKFDIQKSLTEEEINKYRHELKTDKYKVFIAASTHKGEDEILIKAFKTLKDKHSSAKLLIAPRHPERFDEVSNLLSESGLKWSKRSQNADFENNDAVLLDTMGELSKLFSVCFVSFIGGSFSDTGGHNPLEAAIFAKPVLSGPCVFNFKDVYKIVCSMNCAVIADTPNKLIEELISFYDDEKKYNQFCANAEAVFEQNRGALSYILERI